MKKETTYIFDAHDIGKALDIGGYSTARTTLEDAENILLQTVETLRGYKTLFKVPNSHESILTDIETYLEGYAPPKNIRIHVLRLSMERYRILSDIANHIESIAITNSPSFDFLVSVFNLSDSMSYQKNRPSDSGTGASLKSGTESSDDSGSLIVDGSEDTQDSDETIKDNEFFDFKVNKSNIRGLPSVEDMKTAVMGDYIWTLSDDNNLDGIEFTTNDYCNWVSEEFGIKIETFEEWRAPGGQRIRRRCSSVLCNLAESEKLVKLCRGRYSVPKEEDFLGEAVVGYPEMLTFGDS